jgi:hypothetical protein
MIVPLAFISVEGRMRQGRWLQQLVGEEFQAMDLVECPAVPYAAVELGRYRLDCFVLTRLFVLEVDEPLIQNGDDLLRLHGWQAIVCQLLLLSENLAL